MATAFKIDNIHLIGHLKLPSKRVMDEVSFFYVENSRSIRGVFLDRSILFLTLHLPTSFGQPHVFIVTWVYAHKSFSPFSSYHNYV
ncbi:MAG TPA: hypothetical protein PLL64_07250 [Rhodothermales bacterium]|nr:hypothetical protein [Rhodothermales bacterium]